MDHESRDKILKTLSRTETSFSWNHKWWSLKHNQPCDPPPCWWPQRAGGGGTAWTWSLKVNVSFHFLARSESAALWWRLASISNTSPCQSECSAITSLTLSVCSLGLTSARRPRCELTCQHVSLCTCLSQPVSYTNLCCRRARCTSQSTQQAGSCPHAALQPLQISKPLCCFSGASALKATAKKEGSETEPHTSLRAHQDAWCSLCGNEGCRSHHRMKWRDVKWPKKGGNPYQMVFWTWENLKIKPLLSHNTQPHWTNHGQLSSSLHMIAGVWCDSKSRTRERLK